MNVVQYQKRLKSFKVEESIKKSAKENSEEIINLNKVNLSKGLNSLDKIVGRYSSFTAAWAKKLKPNKPKKFNSLYNFDWTGSFINGIFITYEDSKMKFSSRGMGGAKKTRFIKNNKLLGLSDAKGKIINNSILIPTLRKLFKSHINK
jgi:hypothetical protein|tara:strand:+ start:258 stop:701 length:444 start_codon:yes stop_codon:yes gene_type:complete